MNGIARLRGKSALLGDSPAGNAKVCDEGYSVGISARFEGGIEHEGADGVVAAEVSPDLLAHEFRGFRAQHCARPALMGLQLIEGGLDLPSLGVGAGQFDR